MTTALLLVIGDNKSNHLSNAHWNAKDTESQILRQPLSHNQGMQRGLSWEKQEVKHKGNGEDWRGYFSRKRQEQIEVDLGLIGDMNAMPKKEGDDETKVRWKEGILAKQLSYLTNAEAIAAPSTWEDIAKMTSEEEKEGEKLQKKKLNVVPRKPWQDTSRISTWNKEQTCVEVDIRYSKSSMMQKCWSRDTRTDRLPRDSFRSMVWRTTMRSVHSCQAQFYNNSSKCNTSKKKAC